MAAALVDVVTPAARHLAHQGGWDEILFVLVPIVLFAGLLLLANHRAGQEQSADELTDPDHPG